MTFLIAFVVWVVAELYALILVSNWIGFWSMLGLLVLISILGTAVIRYAGIRTLRRYVEATAAGEQPARELGNGAGLLVAGILLTIPGFVSGAIGALLLLPPFRSLATSMVRRRAGRRFGRTTTFRTGIIRATYDRPPDIRDAASYEVRGELEDRPPRDDRRPTEDRRPSDG